MGKKHRAIWIAVAIFIAISLVSLTACAGPAPQKATTSSPAGGPKNGLIQTSSGAGVDISVAWRGIEGGTLVFDVSMDTHSGSLDGIDLKGLAVLRDSGGAEYKPASWNAEAGGHHRKGVLTFSAASLDLSTAKYVEIIMKDTAGVPERDFKWQLG